jgi:hypothetical protein
MELVLGWVLLMALGWAAVWWTGKAKEKYWSPLETDLEQPWWAEREEKHPQS